MYKKYIKKSLDIFFALFLLIGLSPFFLLLILTLLLVNNGQVFFVQNRVGYGKKIFKILKFKTMTDAKDSNDKLLPDEQRLTFVGKLLRKTSLDELPQLFNILKGEMSFVGPRPLLPLYQFLYTPYQDRRHEVYPGITGLVQVNGRNKLFWENRFNLDVNYVEQQSFFLDIKIILKTLAKFFYTSEAISEKTIPIEPFCNTTHLSVIGLDDEYHKKILSVIKKAKKYTQVTSYSYLQLTLEEKKYSFINKNCIIAVYDNVLRKKIAKEINANYVVIIASTAKVSKYVPLGKGTQILENAVITSKQILPEHSIIEN